MAVSQPYECEANYCPFSDRWPMRNPTPVSGLNYPLCKGDLVDETHIMEFCIPYTEAISERGGLHIGFRRLAWLGDLIRRGGGKSYSKEKMGQVLMLLPLLRPRIGDFGTFLYETAQFATMSSSAWYVLKRTERNMRDFTVNTGYGQWTIEGVRSTQEDFMGRLLQRSEQNWLKRAIECEEYNRSPKFTRTRGDAVSVERPYVFSGASERIDLIVRFPDILENLMSALPSYYEELQKGLNQSGLQ